MTDEHIESAVTLIEYLLRNFPINDQKLIDHLNDNATDITNWRQFVEFMEWWCKRTDYKMNIAKSSTFAVTQEFLGKLSGEDLVYAQNRGGFWTSMYTLTELFENTITREQYNAGFITFRMVVNDLRTNFPE